jgi:translin
VSFPDIYWSGYVQDAQKEYAEACITYSVVCGQEIPGPDAIGVEDAAYLNGMGEAIGELRRQVLDLMRRGDIHRAEILLGQMDEMYSMLVSFDYPEAITGGLKRTTDVVRGIMERTRGELTVAWKQHQLQQALERFQSGFPLGGSSQSTI